MKFIHCADFHLGSPLEGINPEEKRRTRQNELLAVFSRIADAAQAEGAAAVIIAGDLFDSDCPSRRDLAFAGSVIASHPGVDFLYLRGNHDAGAVPAGDLPNLRLFGDAWQTFRYGEVRVCGAELTKDNYQTVYDAFPAAPGELTVAVMHGQPGGTAGPCDIDLGRLRGRGIGYLALGHLHSYAEYPLDAGGTAVMCGCPEGRGFDETGTKGYVLLEAAGGRLCHRFVPFSSREAVAFRADITGAGDLYAVYDRVVSSCPARPCDMLRLELTGEPCFDTSSLCADLDALLEGKYLCVSVKDRTEVRCDAQRYAEELSLRGEFVRTVLADTSLSDELRRRVLAEGLRALKGGGA